MNLNIRRRILKALESKPKTVPIEHYNPPMHGSEERLARCCGGRFVGVRDGDTCPSCGARFTSKKNQT